MTPSEQLRVDLDAVAAVVSYLTITTNEPMAGSCDRGVEGTEWIDCDELLGDPAALRDLIARTGAGRGATDGAVAASVFVQAYVFRLASAVLGPLIVNGRAPLVPPCDVAIRISRSRPGAIALRSARTVGVVHAGVPGAAVRVEAATDREVVDAAVASLFAHVAALVSAVRSVERVGERLLWGNAVSSAITVLRAIEGATIDPAGKSRIRTFADDFLARSAVEHGQLGMCFVVTAKPMVAESSGPPEAGSATAAAVDSWQYHRTSCCLWYKTGEATKSTVDYCADCSLLDLAERKAAILARLARSPTTDG